jgi:hypothetical protein
MAVTKKSSSIFSAFSNRSRRPEVGQYVTYTLTADKQGRPRASDATLPGWRSS